MTADFGQASCNIYTVKEDDKLESSPYQVADFSHNKEAAMRQLIEDWLIYGGEIDDECQAEIDSAIADMEVAETWNEINKNYWLIDDDTLIVVQKYCYTEKDLTKVVQRIWSVPNKDELMKKLVEWGFEPPEEGYENEYDFLYAAEEYITDDECIEIDGCQSIIYCLEDAIELLDSEDDDKLVSGIREELTRLMG